MWLWLLGLISNCYCVHVAVEKAHFKLPCAIGCKFKNMWFTKEENTAQIGAVELYPLPKNSNLQA